jgi:hypothetical protein
VRTDGLVERVNGILCDVLAKMAAGSPSAWKRLLPAAVWAYNTSKHSSTKETPYFLVYGRRPTFPNSATVLRPPAASQVSADDWRLHWTHDMSQVYEQVSQNIERAQAHQKAYYDKHHAAHQFKVGDTVLMQTRSEATGEPRKLALNSTGPWRIVKLLEQNLCLLENCDSHVQIKDRINVDRLRPFVQFRGLPSEKALRARQRSTAAATASSDTDELQPQQQEEEQEQDSVELEDDEFIVERLVGHRKLKGRLQFRVKWAGYSGRYNRWIDSDWIVQGRDELLRDYERRAGPIDEGPQQQRGGV